MKVVIMGKSIVIYYSWASHTKKVAEIIATQIGADIQEIVMETAYSKNYNNLVDQAQKEIRAGYRPTIKKMGVDLSKYNVVFVGTPIWWSTMAPPIATFLSENDLGGKTIMPFSCHGGGGKGQSDIDIKKLCPNSLVMDMYTSYEGGGRSAQKEINDWISRNKIQ